MAIVGNDNGHNGDLSLDSQVERALLEGQQLRFLGVAPGSLGEHVDALLLLLDLVGGAGHSGARVGPASAVDEDGAREGHEPAEEGSLLERALGRHGAVLGEHGAEHKHVELGLVVADEDGGTGLAEDVLGILDLEADAGRQGHDVLEGAADGPLGALAVAEPREDDRGEDTDTGAEEQREVAGERAGHEGRLREDERQHVETDGEGDAAFEEVDRVVEETGHDNGDQGKTPSGPQRCCFNSASGTRDGFGMPLKRGLPCGRSVPRTCRRMYDAGKRVDRSGGNGILYALSSDLSLCPQFKWLVF